MVSGPHGLLRLMGRLLIAASAFVLAQPGAAQSVGEIPVDASGIPDSAAVSETADNPGVADEDGAVDDEAAEAPTDYPSDLPFDGFVTTQIRVSPDIGPSRDKIIAFIEAHPGWKVGEPAEFEVTPNPEFFSELLFSRIKRWKFDRARTRLPSDAMDIADIMIASDPSQHHPLFDGRTDQLIPQVPDKPEWGSKVPLPVELGEENTPEVLARLEQAMAPIARHHALLGLVTDQSGELEICLSNRPMDEALCPHTGSNGITQLNYFEPIYIQAIKRGEFRPDRTIINFLLVHPDRAITPLFTAPIYTEQTIAVADDAADPSGQTISVANNNEEPFYLQKFGRYQLIALASKAPIDPRIWSIQPGEELPAELCSGKEMMRLCETMRGTYRMVGDRPFEAGIAEFRIWTDRWYMLAPVGGGLATRAQGLWQAQLFKPRRGRSLGISGDRSPGAAQRRNFEKSHRCGGSYIGGGWIITAAHCVMHYRPGEVQIRLGTRDIAAGGSNFAIETMVIHSDYRKRRKKADIALLRIRTDSRMARLKRKGLLKAVALAPSGAQLAVGTRVALTGWGYTGASEGEGNLLLDNEGNTQRNARFLTIVHLKTRPTRECTRFAKLSVYAARDIICAISPVEGHDACYTDSGGPLTRLAGSRRILVGIVAAGIGCAKKGVPGVYTRIANFRRWINAAKRVSQKRGKFFLNRRGRVVR